MRRLAAIALSMVAAGCASAHRVGTTPPGELAQIRSRIERVAVRTNAQDVELDFALPAKGILGGAFRGLVIGMATPIVIGAVLPAPGTSILGALLSPVTGVAGTIYGAVVARPTEEIENAEAAIQRALDAAERRQPGARLGEKIIDVGRRETAVDFVAAPEAGETGAPPIDAVVDASIERAGLEGPWRIDPPSMAFVDVRARLLSSDGSTVMFEETLTCTGEEMLYVEWAANDGALFDAALESCLDPFAERIVDDFLLLYPLPKERMP